MQDWLNRIGLTLQFIALFLVTPEILGKEKLDRLARKVLVEPLQPLGPFDRYNYFRPKEPANTLKQAVWSFEAGTFIPKPAATKEPEPKSPRLIRAIAMLFAFPLEVFGTLFLGGATAITEPISDFLKNLANRVEDGQSTYLPAGAILFTMGFVSLLAATFVHAG